MRILFDRNVEPRFINAIEQEPWTTTEHVDNHFSQTAPSAQTPAGPLAEAVAPPSAPLTVIYFFSSCAMM